MLAAPLITLALATQVAQLAPVVQVELVVQDEIGSADGGLEQVFGYVSDLAADSDGNVYVLDQRGNRIRVFSASGTYLRTFGGRGDTDGGLNRPMQIDVGSDAITVLNPSSQVSTFSLTGQFLTSEGMPFGTQAAMRIADGWYTVLAEGSISRENPAPVLSVLLGNTSTGVDSVLAVPSTDLLYVSRALTAQVGTSLCGLAHVAIDTTPRLWVASGVDGTLTGWRLVGDERTRSRSVDIAPAGVPLPDSVRSQIHAQLPRQIDSTSEDLYTPSTLSQVCGLERADDDTVWVRLADVGGLERWRAVDTESLQATSEFTAPEGVAIKAFAGSRAYGLRVDAGVMRVMVYRIE